MRQGVEVRKSYISPHNKVVTSLRLYVVPGTTLGVVTHGCASLAAHASTSFLGRRDAGTVLPHILTARAWGPPCTGSFPERREPAMDADARQPTPIVMNISDQHTPAEDHTSYCCSSDVDSEYYIHFGILHLSYATCLPILLMQAMLHGQADLPLYTGGGSPSAAAPATGTPGH
jgi:hypothetical protein